MDELLGDVPRYDVCSGSQQDFLGRGTIVYCKLVQFYRRPKNISFPLIVIVVPWPCCLQSKKWWRYRNGPVFFGCGCPNSSSVRQNIMPFLQFKKRALSLALAADRMTDWRIAHSVKRAPLSRMGLPSLGDQPMKKWHTRGCVCLIPISMMCPNGRSWSCLKRNSKWWHRDG
jgi:hypothetical protein